MTWAKIKWWIIGAAIFVATVFLAVLRKKPRRAVEAEVFEGSFQRGIKEATKKAAELREQGGAAKAKADAAAAHAEKLEDRLRKGYESEGLSADEIVARLNKVKLLALASLALACVSVTGTVACAGGGSAPAEVIRPPAVVYVAPKGPLMMPRGAPLSAYVVPGPAGEPSGGVALPKAQMELVLLYLAKERPDLYEALAARTEEAAQLRVALAAAKAEAALWARTSSEAIERGDLWKAAADVPFYREPTFTFTLGMILGGVIGGAGGGLSCRVANP